MDLNIINILYMFFRLAPFIIVSYFTLQSLFNQDLKGVIYLIGLIVASFVTIVLGGILKKFSPPKGLMPTDYSRIRCTQLTLGNTQPISILPLSQTVFGYTLSYLTYFITVNNLQTQNIATFIIFPLVIVADIMWSTSNLCSSPKYLLISLIIGAIIGTLWAMIIESTNMPNLAYMSGIANKDVCSKPSKSLYKCRSVAK
jgi:hypothetical protein